MRVLKTDKTYEQPYADGDRDFQRRRYCVENCLADVDERQENKNDAFDENCRQCLLPRVAHADNDRVSEIGVETHARAQNERHICKQCHTKRCERGGESGCREDCARVHSRRAEDYRIDGEDISHCHERRDARHHFRFDVGAAFSQLKKFFHKEPLSNESFSTQ